MTTPLSPVDPSDIKAPEAPTARRVLLAETSKQLGTAWAGEWFEELRVQGRAIAGGWPGTMSEARSRVRFNVDAQLTARAMPPLSHSELAETAQITYESARALWFNYRVRDEGVA
jgi:hypothetical protein